MSKYYDYSIAHCDSIIIGLFIYISNNDKIKEKRFMK